MSQWNQGNHFVISCFQSHKQSKTSLKINRVHKNKNWHVQSIWSNFCDTSFAWNCHKAILNGQPWFKALGSEDTEIRPNCNLFLVFISRNSPISLSFTPAFITQSSTWCVLCVPVGVCTHICSKSQLANYYIVVPFLMQLAASRRSSISWLIHFHPQLLSL